MKPIPHIGLTCNTIHIAPLFIPPPPTTQLGNSNTIGAIELARESVSGTALAAGPAHRTKNRRMEKANENPMSHLVPDNLGLQHSCSSSQRRSEIRLAELTDPSNSGSLLRLNLSVMSVASTRSPSSRKPRSLQLRTVAK